MENKNSMEKRYGLATAISMVVGIVIGSGVFTKAPAVMLNNGGSLSKSLLTVAIVGAIMLICSLVFAGQATRHEKVNGLIDYVEAALGETYAYYVAWFMTIIYYPVLVSCLAWVTAQYACTLFGLDIASNAHCAVGAIILVGIGLLNIYAPRMAGQLQVSSTIIKLVPLVAMGVLGTVAGLRNGLTLDALTQVGIEGQGTGMMGAVVAFAFAYEGWIIATTINAELHDAKKNLPRALIIGALVVITCYLAYFVGITGALPMDEIIAAGSNVPQPAFAALFGEAAGTFIFVFIVISCLGTTNGLMMGCARGAYSVAVRGRGIAPKTLAKIDSRTSMATNSAWVGFGLAVLWYLYWHFFFILGMGPFFFNWEPDELPIIALYGCYIPLFLSIMRNGTDMSFAQRYVLPSLALIGAIFMVVCAFMAYGIQAWYFMGFFVLILLIGALFSKKRPIG